MENGIRISGTALGRLTSRAAPAFEARNIIPVLATARVFWHNGKVEMSLTNLDMQIDTWTEAETFGTGLVQVPFQTLVWLARAAGDQMVELSLPDPATTDTFQRLDAKAGGLTAKINLLSGPEDFPGMNITLPEEGLTASQADLARLVSKGRRCISTEETRYYLNGSYLHGHEGKARAVSTDGHRMARIDSNIAWPADVAGIIMPTCAIDAIRHLTDPKANAPVTMRISKTHFSVGTEDWSLRGKVIDGTFPDYHRAIPHAPAVSHFTINQAGLRPLLTMPQCGDRGRPITFDTAEKMASISSSDAEINASIAIEANGQGMRTGFNYRYVADLVRSEGTLRFDLLSPGDPARIHITDPDALFVLMPMRV